MALPTGGMRKEIIGTSGRIRHLIFTLEYSEAKEQWGVVSAINPITGAAHTPTPEESKEAIEAYISNEEQSPQGFQEGGTVTNRSQL